MKNFSVIISLIISTALHSQVGINTPTPNATLEVNAKNINGSTPEGIIPPRLTGDQIKAADAKYGINQTGALVYAIDAVGIASTKTINITESGYYFFDGNVWKKMIAQNQNFFIPSVVTSGTGISNINMANASGYTKWSFNISTNDGNWNTTTNTYTVSKDGFYQMSLQGNVEPSTGNNSFSWILSYTFNSINQFYEYNNFINVSPGFQYNKGGIIVLFLTTGTQLSFGGTSCNGCGSNYIARDRSFSIMYLGK